MLDLTNQKFGLLTARWPAGMRSRYVMWLASCDCGKTAIVRSSFLTSGHTKSCGCMTKAGVQKHGHSKRGQASPTYISWRAMLARCLNPKHKSYARYGGMGITVDQRWQGPNGFANFIADLGERPAGTSLDRYPDAYGNYERGNCRWATRHEQRINQRKLADILLTRTELPLAA
jgi:hypothetical protein